MLLVQSSAMDWPQFSSLSEDVVIVDLTDACIEPTQLSIYICIEDLWNLNSFHSVKISCCWYDLGEKFYST